MSLRRTSRSPAPPPTPRRAARTQGAPAAPVPDSASERYGRLLPLYSERRRELAPTLFEEARTPVRRRIDATLARARRAIDALQGVRGALSRHGHLSEELSRDAVAEVGALGRDLARLTAELARRLPAELDARDADAVLELHATLRGASRLRALEPNVPGAAALFASRSPALRMLEAAGQLDARIRAAESSGRHARAASLRAMSVAQVPRRGDEARRAAELEAAARGLLGHLQTGRLRGVIAALERLSQLSSLPPGLWLRRANVTRPEETGGFARAFAVALGRENPLHDRLVGLAETLDRSRPGPSTVEALLALGKKRIGKALTAALTKTSGVTAEAADRAEANARALREKSDEEALLDFSVAYELQHDYWTTPEVQEATRLMAQLRHALLASSGVSRSEARIHAASVTRREGWGQGDATTEALHAALADALQLSRGLLFGAVQVAADSKGREPVERASAESDGTLFHDMALAEDVAGNVLHEAGHFLEDALPSPLLSALVAWLRSRTGEATARPLRELTGHARYRPDERAIPGRLPHPYLSKVYPPRPDGRPITELVSFPLAHFASAEAMVLAWHTDPELFTLIVGLLTALEPYAAARGV